jgi:hypothetical protein
MVKKKLRAPLVPSRPRQVKAAMPQESRPGFARVFAHPAVD